MHEQHTKDVISINIIVQQEVNGKFTFADELEFEREDWGYCVGPDRRFHSEKDRTGRGIRPAGELQYSDRKTPLKVPLNCYDVGDGWYDPVRKAIVDVTDPAREVRAPQSADIDWITKHAVKGMEE